MIDNRVKVVVYDLTIADLTERRNKKIIFDSVKRASAKTGISETIIRRIIKNRDRVFSEKLNKEITIRLAND